MICFILGAIFVWGGFAALLNYNDARGYLVMLFGIGFFVLGFWLRSRKKPLVPAAPSSVQANNAHNESVDQNVSDREPDTTFSFKPTGFTFDCLYSDRYERQDVIIRSRIDDSFHLREYEWEGKPAYALVSDRLNADFAVVPAKLVDKIKELNDNYKIIGHITNIKETPRRRDTVYYCDVQLSCYKDADADV